MTELLEAVAGRQVAAKTPTPASSSSSAKIAFLRKGVLQRAVAFGHLGVAEHLLLLLPTARNSISADDDQHHHHTFEFLQIAASFGHLSEGSIT